jgi:hypothetical protein
VLATRGAVQGQTINARPCLTINKLPQHVRQVTNEQRQNRPSGKVIPADDKADVQVAEIYDGMVRHIEYLSDADVAYYTACENQVTYGEGYIRVLTEYCNDNSFDQDLRLGRIRNAFSVYMDPMIHDPCGSDAEWCFITEDILKEEYERMFPDATPISTLYSQGVGDQGISSWLQEDTIRIAEYFYNTYDAETLHLYPNNQTATANSPEDKQLKDDTLTSNANELEETINRNPGNTSNKSLRSANVLNQTLTETVTSITSRGKLVGVRKVRDYTQNNGKVYVGVYQWSEKDLAISESVRTKMNKEK